jgi:hypothetical protein
MVLKHWELAGSIMEEVVEVVKVDHAGVVEVGMVRLVSWMRLVGLVGLLENLGNVDLGNMG